MLVEHTGGAGSRTRKDELEQQSDKAGRECRGDDTADDIVNGGSILVFGAVDLEGTDLGSRGALGVLGDMRVHGAGDVGVLAQDELVGPNLDIALDGASMVTVSPASAADLVEPRRATVSPIA